LPSLPDFLNNVDGSDSGDDDREDHCSHSVRLVGSQAIGSTRTSITVLSFSCTLLTAVLYGGIGCRVT
jgi:hypothetical protein